MKKKSKEEPVILNVRDASEVLNPFAPDGEEILSDEYFSLLHAHGTRITSSNIRICFGDSVSEEEKQKVSRAVRNNTLMILAEIEEELKRLFIMCAWFAVSFAITAIFMLTIGREAEELVFFMGCVLAYFFGIRLLMLFVMKIVPQLKRRKIMLKISSLTKVPEELVEDRIEGEEGGNSGRLEIRAKVGDIKKALRSTSVGEDLLITEAFGDFILKKMPFIDGQSAAELNISGGEFSEDERRRIGKAVRNCFRLKYEDVSAEMAGQKRIYLFALGIAALLCVLTCSLGEFASASLIELIVTVVWFLADYALELAVMSRHGLKEKLEKYAFLRDMDVNFL